MFIAENRSTEDQIRELLQPLDHENAVGDYRLLFKAVSEFKLKLHSLESAYGEVYLKLCLLEQKITHYKNGAAH